MWYRCPFCHKFIPVDDVMVHQGNYHPTAYIAVTSESDEPFKFVGLPVEKRMSADPFEIECNR